MITNKNQNEVVNAAKDWFYNSPDWLFQITGKPGTGKSVVLNLIIEALNLKPNEYNAMAYTGAATIVMRLKGMPLAKTCHSTLYEPVETYLTDRFGQVIIDPYYNKPKTIIKFVPKKLDNIKLLVIDEGFMVPYEMGLEIKKRGIKTIVAGDINQLPPVNAKPAFFEYGKIHYLTEIMRQNSNSYIPILANRLLNDLPIHKGFYGDVLVIDEDDLTNDILLGSEVILCGKNYTRDVYNNHIRNLLNLQTDIPSYGEKIICRKNNWQMELGGINLANGLAGTCSSIPDPGKFDGKIFSLNFTPYFMNQSFEDIPCDYKYFTSNAKDRAILKNDKYSIGEKFEFGYALTTHLAQGSQYRYGIYFEEWLNKDINKNLNYTALTRFSHGCIYVKQKRKFSNNKY